ncbi:hypothetical protein EDD28_0062 [Salana multivorans]|uniref:Uncharacterized protein n=1 Tax=Salana multivorans TaxID=120377 RepID=A0A3N2D6V8_9MICO|nr:hypothetical protein [Salana multivorans]ROR95509.1 hypothetical protein EDD28_0062 [Salana multivorans]
MSTRELVEEADQAAVAYQVALAKLGASTMLGAIRAFSRLNPSQVAATKAGWLKEVTALIRRDRVQGQRLAIAYYRLSRALRTGRTIGDPFAPGPVGKVVTLAQLRREFERAVAGSPGAALDGDEVIAARGKAGREVEPSTTEPKSSLGRDDPDLDVSPGLIEVEELPDLDEVLAGLDREVDRETEEILKVVGPDRLEKKRKEREQSQSAESRKGKHYTPQQLRKMAKEDEDAVAAGTAGQAERLAKNGARQAVARIAERDPRAIGWVRRSLTGTPCGWCAMLISRGLIFYTSKRAASRASGRRGSRGDGERYHDHCQCVAEPVYSREQYFTSNIFDLNRRYAMEWPRITKGFYGKEALSVWRAHIRSQQSAKTPASRAA